MKERKKEVANETVPSEISKPMVLPAFKITDVNGNITGLQSLKGKKVFINLWATWCPPCRTEIPSIEKLYSKVDKTKVAFVMLSLDNDMKTAVNFATKNKLATSVYYPAENLPSLFKVEGIPVTYIFDEQGNLIRRVEGGDNYDTAEYLKLLSE